jgi:hypothetical protein
LERYIQIREKYFQKESSLSYGGFFLFNDVNRGWRMKLAESLSQEKFQEILQLAYLKGQETKTINVKDLIEEIREQLLSALNI